MSTNIPPVPQPKKKGLSPLAWIGIGCLGLLVIGGIVATVITVFVARKVSEVASEMEEDPVATTAKLLAAANPGDRARRDRQGEPHGDLP